MRSRPTRRAKSSSRPPRATRSRAATRAPGSPVSELRDEAISWLEIPSISAGARNEAALQEAAEWAMARVLKAGGTCELVPTPGGAPLVVGELRAARDDAPTVMIYGHYDVQDPGDLDEWDH